MEARIVQLARPIAGELGVDVLKVSVGSSGSARLVQVVVDRAGGVDADTLARISRGLSLQLDVEDLISGRYRLEISSPGLDWPLTDVDDFRRHQGEWIAVTFADGRKLEGWNQGLSDGMLLLEDSAGQTHRIALADTAKVRRAINWERAKK
ncbi:MAG: ribosome maturation factor RimP [Zetaproteobacteria bacterium]|nr:MAG: ribosome maturation factor RimP [Zetaproteobacteria bacterium]